MAKKYARRPDFVNVSGRTINVTVARDQLNTSRAGMYSYFASAIVLDSDMADEPMKATALHEVVHAIDMSVGSEMSEQSVSGFASVLFSFLRDNPEFVAWVSQNSVTMREV